MSESSPSESEITPESGDGKHDSEYLLTSLGLPGNSRHESKEPFVLPELKPEEQLEEYLARITKANERYRNGTGISLAKGLNDQILPEVQPYIVEALARGIPRVKLAVEEKYSQAKREEVIATAEKSITWAGNNPKTNEFGDVSFEHTNRERWFGDVMSKSDNIPYSQLLFGLCYDPGFGSSVEVHRYFKESLDGANILLLGGGHSVKDLVAGISTPELDPIRPNKIICTDISYETTQNEPLVQDSLDSGMYVQAVARAEDPEEISKVLRTAGVTEGVQEIWASFSVPYYLETPEQIRGMFDTIRKNLAPGGTARIAPLAFQVTNDRLMERPSEIDQTKEALMAEIRDFSESPEYNTYVFSSGVGATFVIKRLKSVE